MKGHFFVELGEIDGRLLPVAAGQITERVDDGHWTVAVFEQEIESGRTTVRSLMLVKTEDLRGKHLFPNERMMQNFLARFAPDPGVSETGEPSPGLDTPDQGQEDDASDSQGPAVPPAE